VRTESARMTVMTIKEMAKMPWNAMLWNMVVFLVKPKKSLLTALIAKIPRHAVKKNMKRVK
jgi:hypothetical protein